MRLRWLDLLRSAAILGMIVYHTAFDLQFFHRWNLDVTTGAWKIFQVCVASLFLIVSGISAGFWTARGDSFAKGRQRGWTILSAAMLVSLVTAIVDEQTWVQFGILHLIALSSFILPFLRRLHPLLIAALGVLCIALLPLDLMPHVTSVDYVPPVPWLGPLLLGFAAGIPLSRCAQERARLKTQRWFDILSWPGRHSLWIYLLHQPVLIAVLWIVS